MELSIFLNFLHLENGLKILLNKLIMKLSLMKLQYLAWCQIYSKCSIDVYYYYTTIIIFIRARRK